MGEQKNKIARRQSFNHNVNNEEDIQCKLSIFKSYLRIMDILNVNSILRPSIAGIMVPVTRRQCMNVIEHLEHNRDMKWAIPLPDNNFLGSKNGKGYHFDKSTQKFKVEINTTGNKKHYGGHFKLEKDAQIAVEKLRQQLNLCNDRSTCRKGHLMTKANAFQYIKNDEIHITCRECRKIQNQIQNENRKKEVEKAESEKPKKCKSQPLLE